MRDLEILDLKEIEVDDPTRPIQSKTSVEVCGGREDCQAKLEAKACGDEGRALISEAYDEVYCSKLLGYHPKLEKRLVEDPAKKAAKATRLAQEKLDLEAKAAARAEARVRIRDLSKKPKLNPTELEEAVQRILSLLAE